MSIPTTQEVREALRSWEVSEDDFDRWLNNVKTTVRRQTIDEIEDVLEVAGRDGPVAALHHMIRKDKERRDADI